MTVMPGNRRSSPSERLSPWALLRGWFNLPITLPTVGLARMAGADCRRGRDLFVVCSGVPRWLNGPRGGVTVGNAFLTSGPPPDTDLRRHEVRHADQWAVAGLIAFPVAYAIAELIGRARGRGRAGNVFERLAGLAEGGYLRPTDP
jgi:hypothetical protein